MKSLQVQFPNAAGNQLSGILEMPLGNEVLHFAIFAHCFTCGKDLRAERNITLALTQKGFGVLRFDFTGLGSSGGEFSDTNFSTNIEDIVAAADFLAENYHSPSLLIGHSLGGTAVIMAASSIESVRGVVSLAAPADPEHVARLMPELGKNKDRSWSEVKIAGRSFRVGNHFLEDLEKHRPEKELGDWRERALLIMHSPQDDIVELENARILYESAFHPKSFISLDGADHLLSDVADSQYVGNIIGSWIQRYIQRPPRSEKAPENQVVARLQDGPFLTEILTPHHYLLADEPAEVGGSDFGPTPYEYLAAGLGACTAMTVRMYADRKKWPLEKVEVVLEYDGKYMEDCSHCEDEERRLGRFERFVSFAGDLEKKQIKRLLEIADKCPVHKTLTKGVDIKTTYREADE